MNYVATENAEIIKSIPHSPVRRDTKIYKTNPLTKTTAFSEPSQNSQSVYYPCVIWEY